VGSFAANSTTTYNGTTLNFGNFTASDSGQSATVQTTASTPGSTSPTVSVQSGANAGQTSNVSLPNATTTGLGIANIDLSSPASATNTQGQISGAQTALAGADASLGAQSAALTAAFDNNNILSNNLTASASTIGDTSVAAAVAQSALTSIQQQITISVLNTANTNAGHLNAYLSTYA
jgi:flagellin